MDHYFIAHISIKDEAEYQKYINLSEEIFNKFNGEYLAVDDKPIIIEGSWNYTRTVIIKFNSKEDFNKWYYSEEYQKILVHRITASHCDTILVKGIEKNDIK